MRETPKKFQPGSRMVVFSPQVARKLVILEGELERAEERAEVSEV